MRPDISVLLLIALPASGKSEVRRYLRSLQHDRPREYAALGLGEAVELDDYPYVEFMRLIDYVLAKLKLPPIFYKGLADSFINRWDWGTLIHLLNEDFQNITGPLPSFSRCAVVFDIFARIDRAGQKVGIAPRLIVLPETERDLLIDGIIAELDQPEMGAAKDLVRKPNFWHVPNLEGRTVFIEFSRGVPKDSTLPAEPPNGYRYAFSQLAPAILKEACVLYIKVTPEDSLRKNAERSRPPEGDPDTGIWHGVPPKVMEDDYSGDDFEPMVDNAGWLDIGLGDDRQYWPAAIFDNRGQGCTDVFRRLPETWTEEETAEAALKLGEAFFLISTRA